MNFKYLLSIFFLSLIILLYSLGVLHSKINSSPVLRISYLDVGQGDSTLIQTPSGNNILKVGHHGSDTSTDINFLKSVKPNYGIISSGEGNDYGHPHKEVIDVLVEQGVEVLRTDNRGTISFISDGKSILVE